MKIKKLEFRQILKNKVELGKLKTPVSALQRWKMHFSWDETKIGLRGLSHHPKGLACVRYGLILTNYAMIRAKPSSFDLKAIQS
jgi:hypothetical protein